MVVDHSHAAAMHARKVMMGPRWIPILTPISRAGIRPPRATGHGRIWIDGRAVDRTTPEHYMAPALLGR